MVMGVMIWGGVLARRATYFKEDYDGRASYISLQAELYKYTDSSRSLSGSDIIEFITQNNTKYRYRIITDTDTFEIWDGSVQHRGAVEYYLKQMGYSINNLEDVPADKYFAADTALWTQTHISNELLKDEVYRQYTPYVTLPNSEDTEGLDKSLSGIKSMYDIIDNPTGVINDTDGSVANQSAVIFNFKIVPK